MSYRQKVAISQRMDTITDRGETRDALDCRLPQWLDLAGFLPFPIPNALSTLDAIDEWLGTLRPNALLLSGGNDIGGAPGRDETERRMLAFAEANGLPVLGICRGMQMMAVYGGGSLKSIEGHVRTRHEPLILLDPNDGEFPLSVNSYHMWGLAEVPTGYRVSAVSPDGEIEAMRHQTRPWEGWMWHPEREEIASPTDLARLKALFKGR